MLCSTFFSPDILVTGSHRSGTTWVGQTVARRDDVVYEHEPFNVDHPNAASGLRLKTWFTHFESSSQKSEIVAGLDRLFSRGAIRHAVRVCRDSELDVKTPLRFAKHLTVGYRARPRVLVKDPIALLSAGWIYERYRCRVICMIRNPLGFVGSLKHAGWKFDFDHLRRQTELMQGWLRPFADRVEAACRPPNSDDLIGKTALLWNILHFVILRYQARYRSWLFVRHEDLANDPEAGFRKIMAYLGLRMMPELLRYIEAYSSPAEGLVSEGVEYRPRDPLEVCQSYRRRLSADEIQRVQELTADVAKQLCGCDVTRGQDWVTALHGRERAGKIRTNRTDAGQSHI